ncbi:monocarboxylate transporter 11 isoform X1 [Elephas maximus indicus]|uniref:monocarboxylate transporter 11 isoform X1 n=2 Tax=Elephas maximus indicus TaxID=99487 RepID=UPI0021171678|nr:monocarboxylate transporter 11 isoform X1 [Elephas maximus indicus]
MPVGLSFSPHPQLGGLADCLRSPPPSVPPASQTAMAPKPAGPPDGGWGWVVAASAFAVNGLSYGMLRSLGLALPDFAEHFDRSAQDTAWVSALALAVQQAASPVGSALSTRWGARPVVMFGGVLTFLGFVFSAFARSLLHLYLGLGLLAGEGRRECPGSGWALAFAPALGTLSRYFSRRRVLAVGLALTGNGAASLLLAPALQLLLDTFGWRGALLLLGATTLHLTPCGALLRPLALPGDPLASSRGPLAALGLSLFTRPAFSVFALGTALVGGGYFVPYVHLAPHALDRGLGGYGAALVVAVAAVGDAAARLVCGWLADQGWVPLPRLLAVFGALTGLGLLAVGLVPVVGSEGWGGPLLAAAGAYGLSAGSYAPLVFGVLPGLVGIGGVMQATGLAMMLMSLGGLLGPPLSGFLRDETGDFTASFLVCGSFILSGSFIYVGLPRALPSCGPTSRPATPPPESGELLSLPQVALLSPRDPHSTLNTTC